MCCDTTKGKIMKKMKAETLQALILNALQAREQAAPNANFADNVRAEIKQFEQKSALAMLDKMQALELDIKALAQQVAIGDKGNKADYLAIYALQKVRKCMFALANDSAKMLDGYTFSIVKNLATLQALDNLNAQRSICSKIELSELDQVQAVKVYHNCQPSTASTQASSTRMMLKALGLCNVQKGAKGDSISFTDTAASKALQAMFA